MFAGIAKHEGRKIELPITILFTKLLIFLLFLFNSCQFNDLINKC